MRKFYSGYFKGVPDFKKNRMKLMTSPTMDEILEIIRGFRNNSEFLLNELH